MRSLLFKVVEAVKSWKSIVVSMVRAQTLFIIIIIIIISHSSRERLVWRYSDIMFEKWEEDLMKANGDMRKEKSDGKREGREKWLKQCDRSSRVAKTDDKNQPDGQKGGQEEKNRLINSLFYWRCRSETKQVSGANQQVSVQKRTCLEMHTGSFWTTMCFRSNVLCTAYFPPL